jgi:hypothetical protein
MRHVLTRRVPPFDRVLLVESGPRSLLEIQIPGIFETYGDQVQLDLVTCYAGEPEGFRPDKGRVYRVTDYPGRAGRKRLYAELAERNHNIMGIVCAAEPIMTKWKWVLALQTKAKVYIINENADWFWLDHTQIGTIRHFVLFRAGLSGANAVTTIARLLLFPFTLAFLIAYTAVVHLRRKVHT